jgi:hypothetical protein
MAVTLPTTFQFGAKETPALAASKYATKAGAAGQYWALGYLTAKTDPFVAASNQANYWLSQLNSVGVAGFQAGLARVNKTQVAAMVASQGPSLYAAGISNKGIPRYTASIQNLLPAMQTAAANLPPRGTAAQNDQRQLAMTAYLRSIRGQYRTR